MHLFRVWAPFAASVDVVLPPDEVPIGCLPGADGWWLAEVDRAGHGTDYWFSVDTGKPLPDPRSGWQPNGVHAPSRVFDTGRYAWGDQEWAGRDVLGSVFYELHVGTFTADGTLDAAIERLDDLAALGVDVVELLPVAAFDGTRGWGYDGVDLYAVHQPYGGPEALQRFVDGCHRRGLAVCLDVVYNHLGPSGNYLEQFGPYFTDRHHTPWGQAVNLDDDGRAHVRRWICDNALRWLEEFHVDALRLDAVHALVDDSRRHLLQQLSHEVADLGHRLGRPLALIAESDLNDPRVVEPMLAGGYGMTAQWSDDFHHALHALLTGEVSGYYGDFGSIDVLAHTLTRAFLHDGGYSTFRGERWGRPVDVARHRGHRFLGYLQDHDQVGNRALGDRISVACGSDRQAAGAALVLTSPFTPMLFMGEEWSAGTPWQFFTDFDEYLGDKIRDGRRAEFSRHGWDATEVPDPQAPSTRDRSVLRWTERDAPAHARMLQWYRDLIALRRAEPDLRDDDLARVTVTTGPASDAVGTGWIVVHRGRFD
ncbi:MAG TPA: malto-oligosyltrehalose trehalohydrolase, partial [Kineosporiaceae bacterium]|nr:malto-oligosyltrehalose trehalohydrolase [Kineosporiaceae bacterium]